MALSCSAADNHPGDGDWLARPEGIVRGQPMCHEPQPTIVPHDRLAGNSIIGVRGTIRSRAWAVGRTPRASRSHRRR